MGSVRRHLSRRYATLSAKICVSVVLVPSADMLSSVKAQEQIALAVQSVLGQDYANVELLLTEQTAARFGIDDERVRCVPVADAATVNDARNICLLHARGEYLVWLDGSSLLHPDFVRILLGMALESGAAVVYCAQKVMPHAGEPEMVRYASFSRALLENRPYVDLNSVMHRRQSLGGMEPFDNSVSKNADWLLLLQLTANKAARALPCVLSSAYPEFQANACGGGSDDNVKTWLAADRLMPELPGFSVAGLEQMFSLRWHCSIERPRPVSVVIPSYECPEHLRLCVAALRRFTEPDLELIIVDNASSPAVHKVLDVLEGEGATVIRNAQNAGFTYAVNQGIARSTPGNDVVLLNNDAVVTSGWLVALQQVVESTPSAALVVPRQVLLSQADTISTHQPTCNPDREMDVNLSAHHDNIIDPSFDPDLGLVELSFAPFFCVYIRRSIINELGPLDHEGAPHYRSDRLYCEAVRRLLNRKVIYTPHSKVYHFLQKATHALAARDPGGYDALFVRNEYREPKSP